MFTGCVHAGVFNTIDQARAVCGPNRSTRSSAGSTSAPATPAPNIHLTSDGLREREVTHVMPMHGSGLPAHSVLRAELADRCLQPAVGTVLRFDV